MNKRNDEQRFVNIKNIGNFTKKAVENFEENIVHEKDYLEKVQNDKESQENNKFH